MDEFIKGIFKLPTLKKLAGLQYANHRHFGIVPNCKCTSFKFMGTNYNIIKPMNISQTELIQWSELVEYPLKELCIEMDA